MDPEPFEPFARFTSDDLTETIGIMQDLGRHPGYRRLMSALSEQHLELISRLIRSTDVTETARTQGAIRAISDILEHPGNAHENNCVRLRIINELQSVIDIRKEDEAL